MRFFAIAICLIPSLAFGQWDMGSLEKRVTSLEDRVGAIESKLEGKTTESKFCDCPCNSGGTCICKPGECPNGECPKSSSGRTVGSKSNGRIPGYKNGEIVIYFGGPTAERLASEWACGESEAPAVQSSGHYETQCSGGFCRRVWVPGTNYQKTYQPGGHYETRCSGGFCQRVWVPN